MSTDSFLTQLTFTHFALHRNLDGLSHEESLRGPEPAGNCLNWVAGHVVASRSRWLEALGRQPLMDEATREVYRRGGEPLTDGTKAQPLDSLLGSFDRAQEQLEEALAAMTDEQLDAKAPFSPTNNPDETLRSLAASFLFHEAYHVGQTGILRRLLGRPGALS